jgi:hypothetical protein
MEASQELKTQWTVPRELGERAELDQTSLVVLRAMPGSCHAIILQTKHGVSTQVQIDAVDVMYTARIYRRHTTYMHYDTEMTLATCTHTYTYTLYSMCSIIVCMHTHTYPQQQLHIPDAHY